MATPNILVTASTGNVGRYVSEALHEKQIPFTAATRDAEKAREQWGFEPGTVYLDYREPSGFGKALEGKELLFLCGPAGTPEAPRLLRPLLDEAIVKGIRYIVFVASYPDLMEVIRQTGIDHTFLKGNFFMQNFGMYQKEDIRDHNQIFMPTGKGKAPFVHTRDIGEIAAEALENPEDFAGRTIRITGPEAMDHYRVAEIFSEVLDRKIKYKEPDDQTYRQVMKERGYSDDYITAMIQVFGKIKKGLVAETSDSVKAILKREPIPLREYVMENKALFSEAGGVK